jgi:hypothetical protein
VRTGRWQPITVVRTGHYRVRFGHLVGQRAENEQRTGLTNAERVDAINQLAAFGVSAHQIARQTARQDQGETRSRRRRLDDQRVRARPEGNRPGGTGWTSNSST